MNAVVKVDMVVEEFGQEIKNSLAEYLRTSERVSRAILGILCYAGDTLLNSDTLQLNAIVYPMIFILAEGRGHNTVNDGAKSVHLLDPAIIIARIFFLSACFAYPQKIAIVTLYWYIALNLHDSGGKSIRDMVKNAIGRMRKQFQKT